ncbi:MAG: hypothetical protein WDZ64_01870 [Parcubacteria group bacterium]
MNPEERQILERSLRLSEENNKILRKMQRAIRWGVVWGFIKAAIIIVPLIIGFIYLQPFFGTISETYNQIMQVLRGA